MAKVILLIFNFSQYFSKHLTINRQNKQFSKHKKRMIISCWVYAWQILWKFFGGFDRINPFYAKRPTMVKQILKNFHLQHLLQDLWKASDHYLTFWITQIKVIFLKSLRAKIHLFKVENRNTSKRCEIYSKLTIKTLERR